MITPRRRFKGKGLLVWLSLSGGALGLLLVIFFRHEWDPVFDSGETAGSDMRQLAAGDDDPGPAVPGASNSAGREETAKDFGPLILETLARGEIRLSMDDAAEMLEDWIFADPDAALKFLASLNESRESYSLSSEDFRELLKTIVRGQDLRARSFRQAPEIAVRLGTDVLKGGEQTWFLGDLAHIYFGSLARDSMDGARNLFSTSGTALLSCYHPGEARRSATGQMAECWGWVDFSEALAWAKGLEFPDEREEAFRGLMRSVPDEDGARLERLLPLIESDDLRGHVEARLADWYLSQDLEQSVNWLRSRAGTVSPLADTKILMQAAQLEPGLALGYARDLAGSELQDKAYSTIAKQHVHVDPEACQAWVLDVAAESLRHELVQSVAKGWARDDLEAASAWALSLTDMADRDLALSEIAKEWIKEGYSERARQMALELHDADLRAEWSLRFFDFPDG